MNWHSPAGEREHPSAGNVLVRLAIAIVLIAAAIVFLSRREADGAALPLASVVLDQLANVGVR